MYLMMDSNMNVMAITYFVLLVIFGSFFMLNLILAVIMDAFDQVDELQKEKEERMRAELERILYRHRRMEAKMGFGSESKVSVLSSSYYSPAIAGSHI